MEKMKKVAKITKINAIAFLAMLDRNEKWSEMVIRFVGRQIISDANKDDLFFKNSFENISSNQLDF